MSKRDEKHTSELSMEELDNVAGGGANEGIHGVILSLGNKKTNPSAGLTTAPTTNAAPAAATGTSGGEF